MKKIVFISICVLVISSISYGQKNEWNFDLAHTNIEFIANYMRLTEVNGEFKDFSCTVLSDKPDFTDAEIEFTVQAKSIDTDNDKRDEHLRSEDFFNVEKYPEIKFKGSSLKKVEGKNYKMKGQLTIRDVTKTEEFDVVHQGTGYAMEKTRAGFKVFGTINRFDYNVDWNKTFAKGLIVGEEIKINCDIQLIKQE